MPDFLALDWDSQQVCGVAAQVGRKSVRVKKCFASRWPDDINPSANPAAAGAWLRQQLEKAGIAESDALLSLPREAVSVKPLQLPNVPDDELPGAVRLQTATRFPMPLDQLVLDFIPVPALPGAAGRSVLIATLPKAILERIHRLTDAAGLKLAAVDMSPTAVTTLVRRAPRNRAAATDGLTLVVSQLGQRVEILMLRQQCLVFSHATSLAGTDLVERNRALLIDVGRCWIAAESEGAVAGLRVERVWMLGGDVENPQLVGALEKRFSCSVLTSLDPLSDTSVSGDTSSATADRWSYAPAVGMLLARAGSGGESIDFINPRKAAVKRSQGKLRAGLAAAAVVVLLCCAFGMLQVELADRDRRIETQTQERAQLDEKIAEGKDVLESAAALERWGEQNVNWIEQFRDLKASFDVSGGIFLSDFKVTPPTRGELVAWRATGFARKEEDVRTLYQRLYEQRYRLSPYAIQPSKTDPEYPFQFDLMVELVREGKSAAAVVVPEVPKAADAAQTPEKAAPVEAIKPDGEKPAEPDKKPDAAQPGEDKKTPDAEKPAEKKSDDAKPAPASEPSPVAKGADTKQDGA